VAIGKTKQAFLVKSGQSQLSRYPWGADFQLIPCSETQKLAYSLAFGRLPTLCLEINQATDHLHDLGVNGVSTAKPGGNDGPILDPTDAVLDPHPNLTDGPVVGFLLLIQFSSFRTLTIESLHKRQEVKPT
jgi:hypothetical protein